MPVINGPSEAIRNLVGTGRKGLEFKRDASTTENRTDAGGASNALDGTLGSQRFAQSVSDLDEA
jgi:hypothetical protein